MALLPGMLSIDRYVPHRGVMLWIDRLLEADAGHAVTAAVVRADHPFVRDGALPAWIGIEYMAQTIAAWAGARALQANRPVKIGFLLGTRRYQAMLAEIPVGSSLRITAACEMVAENGLGMFACSISLDNRVIASAQVSVYESDDGAAVRKNDIAP